jgi:hypothetical protein
MTSGSRARIRCTNCRSGALRLFFEKGWWMAVDPVARRRAGRSAARRGDSAAPQAASTGVPPRRPPSGVAAWWRQVPTPCFWKSPCFENKGLCNW